MNPAPAWSATIQTESGKMTEKSATEPQNQLLAPRSAIATTEEHFAKSMFMRSCLIWWSTRLMIGLP
jgi:hypothetical protein